MFLFREVADLDPPSGRSPSRGNLSNRAANHRDRKNNIDARFRGDECRRKRAQFGPRSIYYRQLGGGAELA